MRREPKLFGGGSPPADEGAGPALHVPPPPPAPEGAARPAWEGRAAGGPIAAGAAGGPSLGRAVLWAVAVAAVAAAAWGGFVLLRGAPALEDVPFFTAEEGPFKVRPADPGGAQIPNQDMLVLEGSISAGGGEGLEVLLPRPEEPLPLDLADGAVGDGGGEAIPDPAGGEEEEVVDVAAPVVNPVDEGAEARVVFTPEQVEALVEEAVPGEGEAPLLAVPVPGFKPGAVAGGGAVAAGGQGGAGGDEGLSLDDIASAIGIDEAASAPSSSGAVARVQIASYSSGEAATAAWQRLRGNHPGLLAAAEPRIVEAIIGNATYWRLQVGAFARRADADLLCAELKKREVDCLVVTP